MIPFAKPKDNELRSIIKVPSEFSYQDLEVPNNMTHDVPHDVPHKNIQIETEPIVHFTPYDTVYEDNSSEIRFAPKISVEDKPESTWGLEEAPKLIITPSMDQSQIEGIDLEEISTPIVLPTTDAETSLVSSDDFTELS